LGLTLTVIISVIVVGVLVYFMGKLGIIPNIYSGYYYAVIWLAGVVLITYFLSKFIQGRMAGFIGESNASTLSFVVRLVGYVLGIAGFLYYIKGGPRGCVGSRRVRWASPWSSLPRRSFQHIWWNNALDLQTIQDRGQDNTFNMTVWVNCPHLSPKVLVDRLPYSRVHRSDSGYFPSLHNVDK